MSNLSADAPLRFLGEPKTERYILDTSVAQTIYKGVPLMIDDTGDTEHVIISSAITVAAPDTFVGIAAHGLSVKASDPEREENGGVEVYVEPSIVGFKSTAYGVADLGMYIAMSDTATLSTVGAGKPRIGKLYKVEDGYLYVQLETPWIQAA